VDVGSDVVALEEGMWAEYGRILWVGAGSAKKEKKSACRRDSQKVYWLLGTCLDHCISIPE
jgi:hypothetical protein